MLLLKVSIYYKTDVGADCNVSYAKQIFLLSIYLSMRTIHTYLQKRNHSGGSFLSQVNAEASAASADALEERAHNDTQQDAPQPLQPARADENTLDAWTNHPEVKRKTDNKRCSHFS